MPELLCVSNFAKLEEIKISIRSLLISLGSRDVSLHKLQNKYNEIIGNSIPYRDFNYTCLKDFLLSMPDVVNLALNRKKELCVYHIDTEKTKHISLLKSKEKTEKCREKNKLKLKHHSNLIDPYILINVLQELKKKNSYKISKLDVLSEIKNFLGLHTFFTLEDLRDQLNEFTHILSHDENYIYFKHAKKLKNPRTTDNEYKRCIETNNSSTSESSVSDLIKDSIKDRLQKLIEKYPEGIWCKDLPKMYLLEYKLDLIYSELGFSSVIEFVTALPNIFKIVQPLNSKKLMVIDANTTNNSEDSQMLNSNLYTNFYSEVTDVKPLILDYEDYKSLIPENAMGYYDTVEQIPVKYLLKMSQYIAVNVSDINNPSYFWITLSKNKRKLTKLMNCLEWFYKQQNLDEWRIPPIAIQPGLHIACTFAGIWHRGIIKKIKNNKVIVLFYDYGTLSICDPSKVFFLDKKFSNLAAQAIPCGLENVRPFQSIKWPVQVVKKFSKKVMNKTLIASIINIDEKNNSMTIDLLDVKKNLEEYINEWMVRKKIAEEGKIIYKKSNITFKHYELCKQEEYHKYKLSKQEESHRLSNHKVHY